MEAHERVDLGGSGVGGVAGAMDHVTGVFVIVIAAYPALEMHDVGTGLVVTEQVLPFREAIHGHGVTEVLVAGQAALGVDGEVFPGEQGVGRPFGADRGCFGL